MFKTYLLQSQVVEPQSGLIIILLLAVLLALAYVIFKFIGITPKRKNEFHAEFELELKGNIPLSPSEVILTIKNTGNQSGMIENPVIQFSNVATKKSYKINAVQPSTTFPLQVNPDEPIRLQIGLMPFINFNPQLDQMPLIKVSAAYGSKKAVSKRVIRVSKSVMNMKK